MSVAAAWWAENPGPDTGREQRENERGNFTLRKRATDIFSTPKQGSRAQLGKKRNPTLTLTTTIY